jgi:hypothetical protein
MIFARDAVTVATFNEQRNDSNRRLPLTLSRRLSGPLSRPLSRGRLHRDEGEPLPPMPADRGHHQLNHSPHRTASPHPLQRLRSASSRSRSHSLQRSRSSDNRHPSSPMSTSSLKNQCAASTFAQPSPSKVRQSPSVEGLPPSSRQETFQAEQRLDPSFLHRPPLLTTVQRRNLSLGVRSSRSVQRTYSNTTPLVHWSAIQERK